ncbi:hypothetical protein ACVWW5_000322 [Bradyrhizobium sp. LM3.4]
MLRYFETIAPSTAASISASSNTTNGALPPSSRPSRFTPTEACWYRILPTAVDPVKPTKRTAGCSHSTLPIGAASPVTMLNTPLGTPAFSASTASANADSGVSLAGFSTTVQPAASAGETLRVIIEFGKFHGVIAPQTPIGCLIASNRASGRCVGMVSP